MMVACIILACSIALGGLMVVSPTVRAAVLNWLQEISGNNKVRHNKIMLASNQTLVRG